MDTLNNHSVLVTGGSGFIGTNLVEYLSTCGARVANLDINPPLEPRHRPHWIECDIMDPARLDSVVADLRPELAIHLAARTDCVEDTTVAEGYGVNTIGTENVLRALRDNSEVKRVIVTSSQFVCGPRHRPAHVRDYGPHTVYGASKAESEELTRSLDPPYTWTIVRPVNIWGPYHERYRKEAWRVIDRGLYLHPGREPVVRTYGYVGNVVWQMARILSMPTDVVHRQVLYLGDLPGDIYEWVDEFSRQLTGRKARAAPRLVVRGIAAAGDLLAFMGLKAPLDSSRYRSMTSHYITPVADTYELLGRPPFSLQEGVGLTVSWLREQPGGRSRRD
jgi:nucleoside-diphosphate-sugar epimerase